MATETPITQRLKLERGSFNICTSAYPVTGVLRGPFGIYGSKYGRHIIHLRTGLEVVSGAWLTEKMAKDIVFALIPLGDWEFGVMGDAQGGFDSLITQSREVILAHKETAFGAL